jgi:hypothetical protein
MLGLQLKGINLAPRRDTFDPIETASRDEISARRSVTPTPASRTTEKLSTRRACIQMTLSL